LDLSAAFIDTIGKVSPASILWSWNWQCVLSRELRTRSGTNRLRQEGTDQCWSDCRVWWSFRPNGPARCQPGAQPWGF